MSQIHISDGQHTVTVTHDGADLTYVIEKAQKLFDETKPAERPPGPAIGFRDERQYRHETFAWNMGKGEQPPVRA